MSASTKPKGLAGRVQHRAATLESEGRIAKTIPVQPGEPFKREPGDILILRVKDGVARTKEQALEVARRRDPGAKYKSSTTRMFVFKPGRK